MELNLSTQTVNVTETIYDGTVEQPLECDVLLPDSSPDIQRILRCEVTPALLSAGVNGEKLEIDGLAAAHLYYLDEEGLLNQVEYKIPYTKSIELKSAPTSPHVSVTQSVDYFNCRAVSPRRLDMRGAVSIRARVTAQEEEQAVNGAQEGGLQFLRETSETVQTLPQGCRPFTLREELELGYGKPPVGQVIRAGAVGEVTDCKVISGKAVTKGELRLRVLYRSEEDPTQLELMEYTLPVSQVIDLEGAQEDCGCQARYEVTGLEVTPRANGEGENRSLAVELSANACADAYRSQELETASDCYSTRYETKPTVRPMGFLRLIELVDDTFPYQEQLSLPQGTQEVVDLWCVAGPPAVRTDGEGVQVSGKLTVGLLLRDQEGQLSYQEQARDYSRTLPVREGTENLVFHPRVWVGDCSFNLTGQDQVEVRCSLQLQGPLFSLTRKKVISDVAVEESRPKARRENLLYLYYASQREPLWEIAKRYNTSVEAIQEGNQLEDTVLNEKKMLLIPMN